MTATKFFAVLNRRRTMGYVLDVYPEEIAAHGASLRAFGDHVIGLFDEEEMALAAVKRAIRGVHRGGRAA